MCVVIIILFKNVKESSTALKYYMNTLKSLYEETQIHKNQSLFAHAKLIAEQETKMKEY